MQKNTLIIIIIAAIGIFFYMGQTKLGATMNTYSAVTNSSVSCGTATSTTVVSANSARLYFSTTNDSANTVYLCKGSTCAASTGIRLNASGGSFEQKIDDLYTGAYSCYTAATSTLTTSYKQ